MPYKLQISQTPAESLSGKSKSFYQHDNGIIYSQCIDICAEIYSPCIDICAEEYHFDDNVKNNDFIEMLPQI